MTAVVWIVVAVAAVVVAAVAQYLMKTETLPYRWVVSAIATFIGAAVSSELLFQNTTPEWEGMALWPAIVGGLLVGAVVDLIAQYYAKQSPGSQGHGASIR